MRAERCGRSGPVHVPVYSLGGECTQQGTGARRLATAADWRAGREAQGCRGVFLSIKKSSIDSLIERETEGKNECSKRGVSVASLA
jgi:hypothetical protein